MTESNILLIVDVQNCFMKRFDNTIIDEINNLITAKYISSNRPYFDVIVNAKVKHPKYHQHYLLTNIHCQSDLECERDEKYLDIYSKKNGQYDEKKYDDVVINKILKKKHKSHDLSYHFMLSNKYDGTKKINNPDLILTSFERRDEKINPPSAKNYEENLKLHYLDNNIYKEISVANYNFDNIKFDELINKDQIYIQLDKGLICDMDSFSAFVYHLKYEINEDKCIRSTVNLNDTINTGLLDLLISLAVKRNKTKEINIFVCGILGFACVLNTVIYGNELIKLNKYNNHGINFFNLSNYGTRYVEKNIYHITPAFILKKYKSVHNYVRSKDNHPKENLDETSGKIKLNWDLSSYNDIDVYTFDNIKFLFLYEKQNSKQKYLKYKNKYLYLKNNLRNDTGKDI